MNSFELSFTPEQYKKQLAVCLVSVDGEVILIDITPVSRGIFNMLAAHQNKRFHTMLQELENPVIKVRVLVVVDDMKAASAVRHAWMKENGMPYLNANPVLSTNPKRVRCVDTGEVYPTQKAACEAHGINQSIMSQHLRGVGHYPTVGGLVFKYI